MMKLIKNVLSFQMLSEPKIIFRDSEDGCLYLFNLLDGNKEKIHDRNSEDKIYEIESGLVIAERLNDGTDLAYNALLWNKNHKSIIAKKASPIYSYDNSIIFKYTMNQERSSRSFNVSEGRLNWTLNFDFRCFHIFENQLFGFEGRKRNKIICVKKEDGVIDWQVNVKSIFSKYENQQDNSIRITKFIGQHKSKLYFLINDSCVLKLDNYSGDSQIYYLSSSISDSSNIQFENLVFSTELNLFVLLSSQLILFFDFNFNSVLNQRVAEMAQKDLSNMNQFRIHKKTLYFIDFKSRKLYSYQLVNHKLNEVESFSEFELKTFLIKGNYLAGMTESKTLIIHSLV